MSLACATTIRFPKRVANACYSALSHPDDQFFEVDDDEDGVDVVIGRLSSQAFMHILTVLDHVIPDDIRDVLTDHFMAGVSEVLRTPADFHRMFAAKLLASRDRPVVAFQLAGEFYPLLARCDYEESFFGVAATVQGCYQVGDLGMSAKFSVKDSTFRSASGLPVALTFEEACEKVGLRLGESIDSEGFAALQAQANALRSRSGRALAATGPALVLRKIGWWTELVPAPLGAPGRPAMVIVESDLETKSDPYERSGRGGCAEAGLPFVRVFDLGRREYVYVKAADLSPYEYDSAAFDRLAVDRDYRRLLSRVFAPGEADDGVEDLVKGKHGGIIVLASGPPGSGKTMTAEVVAQATARPLYSIGLADLGTSLGKVSENLDKILIRAERWNALLLIDEADVLMARRGNEIERSAIVGLFLHRLEYFRGFLFLTSNLPETLDPAILSRVTLHHRYPALDAETRAQVWLSLLDNAGLQLTSPVTELAALEIDGRRIRSAVRLARRVFPPGSPVSPRRLIELANAGGLTQP